MVRPIKAESGNMPDSNSHAGVLENSPSAPAPFVGDSPPAAQFTQSPLVAVSVGRGENSATYNIYKDLLTAHSPYCKASLEGRWEEAKNNCVKLEEHDPKALQVIVNWLYRDPRTMNFLQVQSDLCAAVLPTYQLADKLLMPNLQNELVDVLRQRLLDNKSYTGLSSILTLRQAGMSSKPLYVFLLKLHVWMFCTYPKSYNNTLEQKITDVIKEDFDFGKVWIMYVQECLAKKWSDPRKETGCVYHDHLDGSECYLLRGVKRRHE
ncbi:hypothetical protein PMZ80_010182 [Knufia obscura]|uniref:BTB domain-containing protein n=2 Tax=Knufia TaxID=430999 RepID=A0AAN8I3N3_9EURO|nr:hypothetical protein PMZ80_010182 [Knufia obscura]KAK5952922.1 hypothetical protein OHC33_006043 [Knufia fluminis]